MRLWLPLGIFIAVLIIGFFIFVSRISESSVPPAHPAVAGAKVTDISLTDTYDEGTHAIEGAATVPDACTTLTATSSINQGDAGPVIRVDLTAPADDSLCLQIPQKVEFSVTADAAENAVIETYVNGERAVFTQEL